MLVKAGMEDRVTEKFRNWATATPTTKVHSLSQGYQGHTYLLEKGGKRLLAKVPTGWGPARWIRRWMLHHECRVYAALGHIDGVPKCHGLVDGSYLILEYVDGVSIREAKIDDPEVFYQSLLKIIRELHSKGIAHGDLKKKDNILVVDNRYPFLIDFGVAVIRKKRWAPVNHYLYRLFKRFDSNAWVKLKYNRKMDRICEADRRYYHRTWIEYIAGWIKHGYLKMKSRIFFYRPAKK